eukprot:14966561-Heterocapsa_arctica.AAC.1
MRLRRRRSRWCGCAMSLVEKVHHSAALVSAEESAGQVRQRDRLEAREEQRVEELEGARRYRLEARSGQR